MSLKAFLKRCLMQFFIITTCVTAAIGILGLILDPTAKIGYEGFFSPILFGLISLAPAVVNYSRKEPSFRQMLVRKFLHFALLEAALIVFGHWAGILRMVGDTVLFALAVLIIYLTVHWVEWYISSKDALRMNEKLKSLQESVATPSDEDVDLD